MDEIKDIKEECKSKKLSFLFSSKQFSKFIEQQYPKCFSLPFISNYEDIDLSYFDKLDDFIQTGYYTLFLHYLLHTNISLKQKFQRFLNDKCHILQVEPIDLDCLKETCSNYERQTILILSMLYYFI